MAYTEEELAGLTAEERAALEEDDGTETDEEEDDETESGDETEADAGDDAAEGADDGEQQADDGADDGDEGGEPEPERSQQQGPILVAEAPEKAEERLGEIKTAKADLRKKYDDGELTFDEYESQVEALDDERMELKLAINTAETAARIAEQQAINAREAEVNNFLSEVGIPRDPKNLRFATLDVAVRIVANDEANYELSAREILEKAYGLCVEQGTLPARASEKQQDKAQAKPAPKPRQPVPPTLAKVPAAAATDTDDGSRFAYIDRITDPVAREKAFEKLSPADQEAYLST